MPEFLTGSRPSSISVDYLSFRNSGVNVFFITAVAARACYIRNAGRSCVFPEQRTAIIKLLNYGCSSFQGTFFKEKEFGNDTNLTKSTRMYYCPVNTTFRHQRMGRPSSHLTTRGKVGQESRRFSIGIQYLQFKSVAHSLGMNV